MILGAPDIEGITANGEEHRISPFADDTQLLLKKYEGIRRASHRHEKQRNEIRRHPLRKHEHYDFFFVFKSGKRFQQSNPPFGAP
jgi:hypothetical protein